MAIGAIIGAGASLLSNVIGNNEASKNIDKQIQAQQEENQRTRDYNYMLAQKQNEWNIQQWQRENEYNLPTNQMARFKEAGLNPDLAYNQSNLSAQSPQLTSGAPATSADMSSLANKPTFAQAFNTAMSAGLESLSTVAEVKKKDSEVAKNVNEIKWNDILNAQEVKIGNIKMQLDKSEIAVNEEQAKYILENTRKLSEEISKIHQEIKNLVAQEKFIDAQRIHEIVKTKISEEQLSQMAERFGLEKEQMRANIAVAMSAVAMNKALAFKYGEEGKKLEFENGVMKVSRLTDDEYRVLAKSNYVVQVSGNKAQSAINNRNAQKAEAITYGDGFLGDFYYFSEQFFGSLGQIFGVSAKI